MVSKEAPGIRPVAGLLEEVCQVHVRATFPYIAHIKKPSKILNVSKDGELAGEVDSIEGLSNEPMRTEHSTVTAAVHHLDK